MAQASGAEAKKPKGALFVALSFQFFFAMTALAIGSLTGVPALAAFSLDTHGLVWGAAGTSLLIGLALLVERLFPRVSAELEQSARRALDMAGIRLSWPVILALSVAAGVAEELLFRGALQGWAAEMMPLPPAVVLPNLLFTALHPNGPLHMLYVFAIGLLLGGIFAASGSLLAVMLAHALYDVYALRRLRGRVVRARV